MLADHSFDEAWRALSMPFQVALRQAWDSFRRRGLPVGAVVSLNGEIVSVGRNRVYDAAGGDDPLQRTALAHAEINAIASVPENVELDHCMIWTTQAPCSMCRAAIEFTEIVAARYLASDPSSSDADGARFVSSGSSADVWVVVANTLFLHNVAWVGGRGNPILEQSSRFEPEIASLALGLVDDETLIDAAAAGGEVNGALSLIWPRVASVQQRRLEREA